MRFCLFLTLFLIVACPVKAGDGTANQYPAWLTKILPNLFPADAGKPQPHETLQAPFADLKSPPIAGQKQNTNLDQPHRPTADVGRFALDVISNALSFKSGEDQKHFAEVKNYFSDFGLQDMQNFLTSSNILPSLQGQNLQLSSVVNAQPRLRSEGAVQGVYKWLFDIPITVTLMPINAENYKQAKNNITNRALTLRLQITRSPTSPHDGLLVERFMLASP